MKKGMILAGFVVLGIFLSLVCVSADYGSNIGSSAAVSADAGTSGGNSAGVKASSDTSIRANNSAAKESVRAENKAEIKAAREVFKEERNELSDEQKDKIAQLRERIKAQNGKLRIEGRQEITIRELSDERKEILAGKINARTGLNLTAEDIDNKTELKAYLSNGRHAAIKIMPDKASAVALQRLNAKCAERNCSVELREVGKGNASRVAYEAQTDKDTKVFLIFKKRMIVRAQVDAETGEVILTKKPWWAFIAREKDESLSDEQGATVEGNAAVESNATVEENASATAVGSVTASILLRPKSGINSSNVTANSS